MITLVAYLLCQMLAGQEVPEQHNPSQDYKSMTRFDQEMRMQKLDRMARSRDWKAEMETKKKREAMMEEYFFAEKFNALVARLTKFAEVYNQGKVDAKSVKAVEEAWRALQKTDGWFKTADPKKVAQAASCPVSKSPAAMVAEAH